MTLWQLLHPLGSVPSSVKLGNGLNKSGLKNKVSSGPKLLLGHEMSTAVNYDSPDPPPVHYLGGWDSFNFTGLSGSFQNTNLPAHSLVSACDK